MGRKTTYRTDCPEIATVTLYIPKPLYLHGYVFPFIILYASWLYVWVTMIGTSQHFEAGMLGFAACGVLQVLSCLFCHWFVSVRCAMTCKAVSDIADATVVQVVPTANNGYPELVHLRHSKSHEDGHTLHWFTFQKGKFTFDEDKNLFLGTQFPVDWPIQAYIDSRGLQTEQDLKVGEEKYGKNDIVLDIPKFAELFKERATAPFFVFQVFCVGLWCLDEYWYYSLFTLAMLVVFECTLVQQQLRHISEIRKMGNKPYMIQTYRNKKWSLLRTDELIPGDLLAIARPKTDQLVPCDLLLLRGQVIVDEAMLTGESVPVMKEPADSLPSDHLLDINVDGKLHVLFGGTKIVQHTAPPKTGHSTGSQAAGIIRAPDNSCLALVLRNGFSTSQGRLLKTILYSVKRVTANNLETFLFILFLLVFAIAASAYVWINGTADPKRNRYKLFLECTLILTSVVPPELPIELSLAVNSSLIALSKQLVYCTEPFRIPFAGKIDICCFDKTGTLTRDEMVVEGVAGLDPANEEAVVPVSETPLKTIQVLASCHSLVQLDSDMVGDPLEKAILKAADWTLTRGEAVIPRGVKSHPLKIFHRYHFSSTLRRMSVIAGHTPVGSTETRYLASVKGSPEALKHMFVDLPDNYDKVYLKMARRGARVLALGYRDLGVLSHQQVREMRRDAVECDLHFSGFVIISCPLKSDSKSALREIISASHHVTMITGDNPLTACHVARELRFTVLKHTLILTPANDLNENWHWQSVDDSICLPWRQSLRNLTKKYDLCLTGEGMTFLGVEDRDFLRQVLPAVKVFARVSPKQKEQVLTTLKTCGFVTLMVGDGTNDVGALKHAHVGVALLANAPERLSSAKADAKSGGGEGGKEKEHSGKNADNHPPANGPVGRASGRRGRRGGPGHAPPAPTDSSSQQSLTPLQQANKRLATAMAELEEEEMNTMVRLGDASIAAPFTCKLSSVYGVCQIIKQGRCTLVTTLQMFKILALNALILAYSQSVLFLDGVKFSDTQATLQGLLLAGCFLFISRSKPLKVLSQQRPLPNIFNLYTLMTVICQFGVHFCALMTLTKEAKDRMPPRKEGQSVDLEAKFEPNLLNSVVYLISMGMQITTFSVNYKGHPFMESLFENRPLLYSLALSGTAVLALASGLIPDAAKQFEIVTIPEEFRMIILKVIALDFVVSLLIDRILDFLAGKARVRRLVR